MLRCCICHKESPKGEKELCTITGNPVIRERKVWVFFCEPCLESYQTPNKRKIICACCELLWEDDDFTLHACNICGLYYCRSFLDKCMFKHDGIKHVSELRAGEQFLTVEELKERMKEEARCLLKIVSK
jgi:hypothetical protein